MSIDDSIADLLAQHVLVLAPMEDVTDAPFRRACRAAGATLCVTEFVGAEHIIANSKLARRRTRLAPDDRPTAIQIYGANPDLLLQAAVIAARAEPDFLDINCGCWVPRIASRGAGAGWLRDPAAMVEMARRIAAALAPLPVTVKTRIGYGPESHMPIVDLARRLEDAGVAALTIHCRTAQMGHSGAADWSWARRAREVVSIPVVVNGDIRTADDVVRSLAETGCAAAMIGRAAIDHPWIFREARALRAGLPVVEPTLAERVRCYRDLVLANVDVRGEHGVAMTRRHVKLLGPLVPTLKPLLYREATLAGTLAILADALHSHHSLARAPA